MHWRCWSMRARAVRICLRTFARHCTVATHSLHSPLVQMVRFIRFVPFVHHSNFQSVRIEICNDIIIGCSGFWSIKKKNVFNIVLTKQQQIFREHCVSCRCMRWVFAKIVSRFVFLFSFPIDQLLNSFSRWTFTEINNSFFNDNDDDGRR